MAVICVEATPWRRLAPADRADAALKLDHLVELRDGDAVEPHVPSSADPLLDSVSICRVARCVCGGDLHRVLRGVGSLVVLLALAIGRTPRTNLLSTGHALLGCRH